MTFPTRKRNWKKVRATSLREAFRLCKEYARESRNYSVARIAELLDASEEALYKWLANASMPSSKIPQYEHICGCHLVTEYLAATANRLVVEIPTGKPADAREIVELQTDLNDAIGALLHFYAGDASLEDTERDLVAALKGLAFHRENVRKTDQPELVLHEGAAR